MDVRQGAKMRKQRKGDDDMVFNLASGVGYDTSMSNEAANLVTICQRNDKKCSNICKYGIWTRENSRGGDGSSPGVLG